MVNVTECCASNNVSSGCLDICSFSIDYDLMKTRPDCLPEFHAMMQCASDGEIFSKHNSDKRDSRSAYRYKYRVSKMLQGCIADCLSAVILPHILLDTMCVHSDVSQILFV